MRHILIGMAVVAVAAIAFFVVRFAGWWGAANEQIGAMDAAYVANPDNRTVVLVRGWSRMELDEILKGFLPAYDLPMSTVAIAQRTGDIFALTFPNDIRPTHLYFLVNYLRYPKEVKSDNRMIGVAGHVVLGPAWGIPDAALAGKQATIYVPADDTEYDEVYAWTETGEAYRISFTDLIWHRVDDPRVPSANSGL